MGCGQPRPPKGRTPWGPVWAIYSFKNCHYCGITFPPYMASPFLIKIPYFCKILCIQCPSESITTTGEGSYGGGGFSSDL